jgi:hypothetical protein
LKLDTLHEILELLNSTVSSLVENGGPSEALASARASRRRIKVLIRNYKR